MNYSTLKFSIEPEVLRLGVTGAYLAIGNLHNKERDSAFDEILLRETRAVLARLSSETIDKDPILLGFRQLHNAVGRSNKRFVSSPENLLELLLKKGSLPRINLLVDIYNLVSIKTKLALGAHNIGKIYGDVVLKITDGTEGFVPLGSLEAKPVGAGEYSYVDGANDVICRLEVRQVEKTKVETDTTECFYIVQGNSGTSDDHIRRAVDELVILTRQFCGGDVRYLYTPWAM